MATIAILNDQLHKLKLTLAAIWLAPLIDDRVTYLLSRVQIPLVVFILFFVSGSGRCLVLLIVKLNTQK